MSPIGDFAVRSGLISELGPDPDTQAGETVDARGCIVLPGFVDCHTHALYAGSRIDEHVLRREGATYEQIARAGGGIRSTVSAVREASVDALVDQSLPRVRALLREGVTTIEIKSGYGLDVQNELKMLEAIRALDARVEMNVKPTFLGAHAVPEGKTKSDYVDTIVDTMLPAVAERKLARTVDIYVEHIGFDVDDMRRIFNRATELGFSLRAHVEQLSNLGGTRAACALGALSCDHLEYLDSRGVEAMANSGAVAVLLPGAFYCLGEAQKPPVALLREHGVPMAVATDLNPGSSPVASLLTCMHMAGTLFGLTPAEVLLGVTRNAAAAVGAETETGTLEVGKKADFTVWDIPEPEFLTYQLGGILPDAVYIGGKRA